MPTSLGNPSNARWTSLPSTFTVSLEAGNNSDPVSLPPFPFKCVLTFVVGAKIGAGGAGDVIDIKRNATAISQLDCDAADKAFLPPSGIDYDENTFNEGDVLTVAPTKVSDPSAILYFTFVRPAP